MDFAIGIPFPAAVLAGKKEDKTDLSYRRSNPLDCRAIGVTYPKAFGSAILTLEIMGITIYDQVPLASIGTPYDEVHARLERPLRMKIAGAAPIKAEIYNPTGTDMPAGSVVFTLFQYDQNRE